MRRFDWYLRRLRLAVFATIPLVGILTAAGRVETQVLRGVDQTRQCLSKQQSQRLAVLFLVDESSSIKDSDPTDERVVAVETALSKLGLNLATAGDRSDRHIDVLVSVFGSGFTRIGEWTSIVDDSEELSENVRSLSTKVEGRQTNYKAGLDGAEQAFVEYERENGPACKVLVWLSDGKLSLTLDGKDVDEQKSYQEVCAATGVAARLRNQGVYTFGIGLSPSTDAGESEEGSGAEIFERMKAITEGSDDCGDQVAGESGTVSGQFIPVGSAEELTAAFGELFPSISGDLESCSNVSDENRCSEFRITVGVPTKFLRLVTVLPGQVDRAHIVSPSGDELLVFENGGFVSSAEIDPYSNNGARLRIDVGSEPGEWVLRVVGADANRATIALFSENLPEAGEGSQISLREGDDSAIYIRFADEDLEGLSVVDGATADRVSYGFESMLSFGSQVVQTSLAEVPGKPGEFKVQIEGDLENLANQGLLYIQPVVQVGNFNVLVDPLTVPVIRLVAADLPQIDGSLIATPIDSGDDSKKLSLLTVPVIGPSGGVGQVTFDASRVEVITLPPGFEGSPILVPNEMSSLEVAEGQRKDLQIALDPNGSPVNGTLGVRVYVSLSNADGLEREIALEVEIPMSKPFETGTFILLLIGMLLLFALIQLAVVVPLSRWVSRVRSLPVSTRVVSGAIEIDSEKRVKGQNLSLEQMFADSRNLGATMKPALVSKIRDFTLRGFPGITYRSLFKPKRVPVYVKRHPNDNSEVTFGSLGQERVSGRLWGCVKPKLTGEWMVSVSRPDIELIGNNPERPLKGYLVYVMPDGSGTDPGQLASKVTHEIAIKDLRKAALSVLPEMRNDGASERGGESAMSGVADSGSAGVQSKAQRKTDRFS